MPAKIDSKTIDFAHLTLRKEKIFTLERLVTLLGCSRRTAQIWLSRWKTYTSYNQNSKFYTFPEIPKFDSHGLWWHKDIAFSKHGNLKKTIIHLVTSSESGLNGRELGELLGLSSKNFVHHVRNCPGICREKHGGVYIHFSDQPGKHKQQVQRRIADLVQVIKKDVITEGDAIIILVAIIKHHGIDLEDILELPEIKKNRLSRSAIQNFMESHDLLKKNPDTRP